MRRVMLSLAAVLGLWAAPSVAAERALLAPPPAEDEAHHAVPGVETVVLAGGCFWGVQAVFQHVTGVINAVSGYAGGTEATARYETVSSGRTGHAEAYHQNFATLHPDHPYIATVDRPKLEALKRLLPDLFREEPVLVTTSRHDKPS